MNAFIAYLVWIILSSMSLRWGIYLGVGYDIGIISPILIMFALHVWISPLIAKK